MQILIEGYPYSEHSVKGIVEEFGLKPDKDKVKAPYVGYYYSNVIPDTVFFLPKVVLDDKENVLGREGLKPEDILDLGDALKNNRIGSEEYDFLYGFSVWIYRAVKEYKRLNPKSEICQEKSFALNGKGEDKAAATWLDLIMSLVHFNEENRDFFMFVVKNAHSGFNKINWGKTVAKCQPIIQNRRPIYVDPINKKKQINFDEELLIIFFSALEYINRQYGFSTPIDFNYDLLSDSEFQNYLDGYGTTRLRQIKYKYFSDKALELWNICYAFFEHAEEITSDKQITDYLVASDFDRVFEAIIDDLISDPAKDIPSDLREQKDGKVIDHIFKYESLVNNTRIYYVGDSKYYKIGASLGDESVYKQYTYAKNIIQLNLNWYYEGKEYVPYRDDETEGYNITPNFFISAEVPTDLSYQDDNIKPRDNDRDKRLMFQFPNRLFDRDTLWLSHYDVNFLYIISLYAQGIESEKARFRDKARALFKKHVQDLVNSKYLFSILEPKEDYTLHRALEINFKRLYGKVFRPYYGEANNYIILGLQKPQAADDEIAVENEKVMAEIQPYFYVHPYSLGENIGGIISGAVIARKTFADYLSNENFYERLAAEPEIEYGDISRVFNDSQVNRNSLADEAGLSEADAKAIQPLESQTVLVGFFNGDEQLKPITKNRLYYTRTGFRPGSLHLTSEANNVRYLFLHQKDKFYLFELKGDGPRVFTGAQLKAKGYPVKHPNEVYLGYELKYSLPVELENIDVRNAILKGMGNRIADSYFTTLKELFNL